eukprot:67628-Chlamydomonas_euryale.AAC.1
MQHTDIHSLCAEVTQVCGSAFWPCATGNIAGAAGGRGDTEVGGGRGRMSAAGGGRGRGRGAGACTCMATWRAHACAFHMASSCPHADVIAQAIATSKGTPKVLWAGATLVGPG